MTLTTFEFIRRFLMHVLPSGFHRIRHYGLFASGSRSDNIARARDLLPPQPPPQPRQDDAPADADEPNTLARPCPCCGGRMIVIERFRRGSTPRHWPERRQRNAGAPPGGTFFKRPFMAVTDEDYADRWSPETWQAITTLCGDNVDGEDVCRLGAAILSKNIAPDDRAALEAITGAFDRLYTAPPYRPQLIEAAILAAAACSDARVRIDSS